MAERHSKHTEKIVRIPEHDYRGINIVHAEIREGSIMAQVRYENGQTRDKNIGTYREFERPKKVSGFMQVYGETQNVAIRMNQNLPEDDKLTGQTYFLHLLLQPTTSDGMYLWPPKKKRQRARNAA